MSGGDAYPQPGGSGARGAFPPPAGMLPAGAPLQPGMPGPLYLEPQASPLATSSLVCGIIGIVGIPLIMSVVAVICGHLALNQIAASQGRLRGKSMATAGLILGYVGIGLAVLLVALVLIIIAVVGARVFTTS